MPNLIPPDYPDPYDEHELAVSPTEPSPSPARRFLRAVREVLETIVPAIIVALLINIFLAQATRVYGQSMEPNLEPNQRLVVEKLSYRLHAPRRGDVVVLRVHDQSELLIKRVIGLPGDTVEIRQGRVFVNGEELDEPYLAHLTSGTYPSTYIPPLHVFVLGDNRGFSNDSRSFGMISIDNILGRAWISYWPVDRMGFVG
jgi:signal peptidase I